jgi:hypothetical protein
VTISRWPRSSRVTSSLAVDEAHNRILLAPNGDRSGSASQPVLKVLPTYREAIERVKYATAEDYMSAIQIALGAAIGAVIGVVIGDVTHLTGYWPHIVVALCAAAGVFVAHTIWPRK